MIHKKHVLSAAIAAALVTACGGDYDNSGGGTAYTPPPATGAGVTGAAYLGPISGGTATLFNVGTDGSNSGAAIETVTTDANGFKFTNSITGPARICVDGGTYLDEATNASQTNTVQLCALVGAPATQVFVTPMSGFVDAIVRAQLKLKTAPTAADFTAALGAANDLIKGAYNVSTPLDAVKPSFDKADATAHPDQYKVGAVLGAYSQLLKDYLARCGGDRHEVLKALLRDIGDKVFDGKTIDATGAAATVTYTCNGAAANLPVGAGSADVVTALAEFGTTTQGLAMDIAGNAAALDNVRAALVTGPTAAAAIKTLPSQGLIAIDTVNNTGYVPIYTKDATGNAQVAVVNLDPAAVNPIVKLISLPGSSVAIATNFFADNKKVYVLAATGSNLNIHIIDSVSLTVETTVAATGLSFSGSFGGVIVDSPRQQVVVAGTSTIGLLDISTAVPTWKANSVINVGGTDSFSLNSQTGLIFISSDGDKKTIDLKTTPMATRGYAAALGTTDGVAFDTLTGYMIITPEFQDLAYVINMNELPATGTGAAPTLSVPGLGTTAPVGEGPGGQVAVNVVTHQALVADEFGHNLRLVQMPTVAASGVPTSTDAFTINKTVLPKPLIGGTATQLGMRGDPNSVTMDPARNVAYMLADTQASYHGFNVTYPLFLVRVPLAGAVVGTPWAPAMTTIQMP